jgi:hypothetical protein
MAYFDRSQWGARAATCSTPLPIEEIKGIAVHYSASGADELPDYAARVRSIQTYHMSPQVDNNNGPWCDIAYNFLFARNGDLFEGRGWGNRSAAQGTNEGNDNYYAICFLGEDRQGRDDVTSAGRKTLGDFLRVAEKRAKRKLDVQPHSHFHSTECPGDELRNYILLRAWEVDDVKIPVPLPKWFWTWNAWRLGEGTFKKFGPKNKAHRPHVPKVIPPWVWARAKLFDAARKRV